MRVQRDLCAAGARMAAYAMRTHRTDNYYYVLEIMGRCQETDDRRD